MKIQESLAFLSSAYYNYMTKYLSNLLKSIINKKSQEKCYSTCQSMIHHDLSAFNDIQAWVTDSKNSSAWRVPPSTHTCPPCPTCTPCLKGGSARVRVSARGVILLRGGATFLCCVPGLASISSKKDFAFYRRPCVYTVVVHTELQQQGKTAAAAFKLSLLLLLLIDENCCCCCCHCC